MKVNKLFDRSKGAFQVCTVFTWIGIGSFKLRPWRFSAQHTRENALAYHFIIITGIFIKNLSLKYTAPIMTGIFTMQNRSLALYGMLMATLLLLLKWLEFRFVVADRSLELYTGAIAMVFTALGIWLALKLTRPKTETLMIEKKVFVDAAAGVARDEREAGSLNLSRRELDVLQSMAEGLSNQEIAERLFVSLNTVKTHASRIFEKMDVKRRTQAVEKARRLQLIA